MSKSLFKLAFSQIESCGFMGAKFIKVIFVFLAILLSSCDCADKCPRCISADDFGTPKSSVSSGFKEGNQAFESDDGQSADGKNANQVVRWQKTGYYTNGQDLRIKVSGAWIPIAKNAQEPKKDRICYDGVFRELDNAEKCKYKKVSVTDPISGCKIDGEEIDLATSNNGRCLIENGYGLYLLFKRKGDPEPNSTLELMRNPQSPVMHLAHSGGFFSSAGVSIKDESCKEIKLQEEWEIYAKIYDNFYWDNIGGYQLEFLKGVVETAGKGFFESIRLEVSQLLLGQTKAIYKNVIANNVYTDFVKALLVLFIIFTGINFLLGMSQNTGTELLVKVLKIALIIQLISPSSWDFFYNNLFKLFTEGLNEIIGVINSHSGTEYDPEKPFYFLDKMVKKIFTIYGSEKTRALVASTPFGFLWALFMFIVMLIYVILVAYAFVVYLTAFVAISLLIILMPIMFLGLLFGPLKHTFDNWFTQAISFCIQSIMIFTLVSLFSAMIMNNFYRTLGFTVCCNKVFILDLGIFKNSEVHNWTFGQDFTPIKMGFSWDAGYKKRVHIDQDAKVIDIPPNYKKRGCRFINYPFLDPGIANSNCHANAEGTTRDWEFIKVMHENDMNLINFPELFTILLLSVMMYHMRDFVQSVGASISGASPFQSVIGTAYTGAMGVGQLYAFAKQTVFGMYSKIAPGNLGDKIAHSIKRAPLKAGETLIDKTREKFGDKHADRLQIAGKVLGGVTDLAVGAAKGLKYAAGMESSIEREYLFKGAFKEIHYVKSVIGYHLGAFSMTGDLTDSAGVHLLKSGFKDGWKTMTGSKQEGFLQGIKKGIDSDQDYKNVMWSGVKESFGGTRKLYKCEMEKIHDHILGVKHTKPEMSIARDIKNDISNPFKKEDEIDSDNAGLRPEDRGLEATPPTTDEASITKPVERDSLSLDDLSDKESQSSRNTKESDLQSQKEEKKDDILDKSIAENFVKKETNKDQGGTTQSADSKSKGQKKSEIESKIGSKKSSLDKLKSKLSSSTDQDERKVIQDNINNLESEISSLKNEIS